MRVWLCAWAGLACAQGYAWRASGVLRRLPDPQIAGHSHTVGCARCCAWEPGLHVRQRCDRGKITFVIDHTLFLQYGLCSITVQAHDDGIGKHLAEVARRVPFWVQARHRSADCTLTIVSPAGDSIEDPKWRAIGEAWAQARQGLKTSHGEVLAHWRTLYQFGQPVDQRLFLFQDHHGSPGDFFCLIPTDTLKRPWHPAWWIIAAVEALAVHWHAARGGSPLHASGVTRRDHGYLFLGPSGAGKSTVAGFGEQVQGTIIHDDRLMLIPHEGGYLLSHYGSHATPVLRAIFLLKQSLTDRVVLLTPQAVGAGLARSLLDYAVDQNLFGPWVRQAFHNVAAVARCVPGYELHFRKSPDFWTVIDAELGS